MYMLQAQFCGCVVPLLRFLGFDYSLTKKHFLNSYRKKKKIKHFLYTISFEFEFAFTTIYIQ